MSKKKISLDGKTWLQYSISIWSDIRKTNGEIALKHPAMFPSMLPRRLIECFSSENDVVFDPFAGIGSTLLAAKELKRYSIGIELSPEYIEKYRNIASSLNMFEQSKYKPKMINGDARNLKTFIKEKNVHLTITSPPYWNILNEKRTAYYKNIKNYGDLESNLGNIRKYADFLNELKNIFKKVFEITKEGGYCCIVLMDIRKKDKFYPFHMDTTKFMENVGFQLDDIIIWDRRQEYNNLRPLGYPYVFRINKVHEFILIFKK